ncbi:MAG: DUF5522 domain-containing protein [Saprospiraceae bacterium]
MTGNFTFLLIKGKDYYIENGLYVFTAEFHKKRGYCCGSGCRHCPYPIDNGELTIDLSRNLGNNE